MSKLDDMLQEIRGRAEDPSRERLQEVLERTEEILDETDPS